MDRFVLALILSVKDVVFVGFVDFSDIELIKFLNNFVSGAAVRLIGEMHSIVDFHGIWT